ncbi:MAG: hypothetical protein A2201_09930 [Alicyclobacillus sp. RIFOXYA1_FULL_53_8]|nr:MAG: hypothetical protein A2201_09930 [Alicyclobacillus sp. RIFOXYA1_FULL_53_8]
MVAALLFWALAVYGALTIVRESVQRLRSRQQSYPVTLVLVVENGETQIEGVLRTLLLRVAMVSRTHRIVVLDLNSTDDTEFIIRNLMVHNECLEYRKIANEDDISRHFAGACLETPSIGCIYDLRVPNTARNISKNVGWLCR